MIQNRKSKSALPPLAPLSIMPLVGNVYVTWHCEYIFNHAPVSTLSCSGTSLPLLITQQRSNRYTIFLHKAFKHLGILPFWNEHKQESTKYGKNLLWLLLPRKKNYGLTCNSKNPNPNAPLWKKIAAALYRSPLASLQVISLRGIYDAAPREGT